MIYWYAEGENGGTAGCLREGELQKMEERRKTRRTQLESKLLMKRVDSDEHEEISIEIVDVSKSGIGFTADRLLKIGEFYEAFLTIWTKEVIHSLLQIVRIELRDSGYFYGAVFVGMADADVSRIGVYQAFNEDKA